MGWMEFVSAMTGHLAWPIAIVILGVLFRRQLRGLLGALDSWEGFGQKLTFSRRLARAEKTVGQAAVKAAAQVEAAYPSPPQGSAFPQPGWEQAPPQQPSEGPTAPRQPPGWEPAPRQSPAEPSDKDWPDPQAGPSESPPADWGTTQLYPGRTTVDATRPTQAILDVWDRLLIVLSASVKKPWPSWSRSADARAVITGLRSAGIKDEQVIAGLHDLQDLRDLVAHGRHEPTPGEALTYASVAHQLEDTIINLLISAGR